jgi:hypothetical protein
LAERRIVRSVNVRSAARTGFALAAALWAIAFVGLVALYLLGLVSGGLGGVEGFIASLGFAGFRLNILPFLALFLVVASLASLLVAIVCGLCAVLYNAISPLVGGLEVVSEDASSVVPPPAREPPPADEPYTEWPTPFPRSYPAVPAAPEEGVEETFRRADESPRQ